MRRIASVFVVLVLAVVAFAAPASAAPGGGGVTPQISVACPNNAFCVYTDSGFNGSMYYFLSGSAVVPGACTNMPQTFYDTISSGINFRNQTWILWSQSNCNGAHWFVSPLTSFWNLSGTGMNDETRSIEAGQNH